MDLEARKLTIIEQFIRIQNIAVIAQFENILKDLQKKDNSLQPFTVEELKNRIKKSMDYSQKGELISNDDLISEIEKWA